jgi:alkaline phosphatase D
VLGRRDLLAAGLGLAFVRPEQDGSSGFTHGVASGEPSQTSVLLWTRYVGSGSETRLAIRVSDRPDLSKPVFVGETAATVRRDHTARITATGLTPDSWWFYRFEAPDGRVSEIGRTRTLPHGATESFSLAVFSCANLRFGWFHAYAEAAERDDIDLAVHLGDYIYEYDNHTYPSAADGVPGRVSEPAHETLKLADYRARYASYRRDPDLQRLHARLPMIAVADDHESADNSWTGGANNHDPATQGSWRDRRAAAVRAWREWMPVSDRLWASYRIGDLATLFRLETRLSGRTAEPDMWRVWNMREGLDEAVATFRDQAWDTDRNRIIGPRQEAWLTASLFEAARRTRWQLLVQGVPMGWRFLPPEAADWATGGDDDAAREIEVLHAYGRVGVPINMDDWGGRPRQRGRLLAAAQASNAKLIVLSGDSHNAYAYELQSNGEPAAAEFGVQSVTSPGLETWFPRTDPRAVADGLVRASPELKWCDASRRGWMKVALARAGVTAEWRFFADVSRPNRIPTEAHRLSLGADLRLVAAAYE